MTRQFQVGEIEVDVVFKNIKHVYLRVYPNTGRVRISAPARMSLNKVRSFAISKLDWIKDQQRKLREQERQTPLQYAPGESHSVWGRSYPLEVHEADEAPSVELNHDRVVLRVRPATDAGRRHQIIEHWYRGLVKAALPPLLAEWEPRLGVQANRIVVRRMKTRWGSCSPRTENIRLNTELAKKPRACLEYVLVHELVHLLEPTHNARFVGLMDRYLSQWRDCRVRLNQLSGMPRGMDAPPADRGWG